MLIIDTHVTNKLVDYRLSIDAAMAAPTMGAPEFLTPHHPARHY